MSQEDKLRGRLSQAALFDAGEYQRLNPDLRGLDPFDHFLKWGAWEPHRAFVERREFARALGAAAQALKSNPEQGGSGPYPDAVNSLEVGVFVSSQGRYFVHEIAARLVADLLAAGARARLLDETTDPGSRPPACIFVAPHEFFRLGRGSEWPKSVLDCGFVFSVDQITSSRFRAVYPYALAASGVFDLYPHGLSLWRDAGVPCAHYAPGHAPAPQMTFDHALYRALPRAARSPGADRPIDVAFFGSESPGRDEFFAKHAAFFAERQCVIHYTRSLGVPLSDTYGGQRTALTRFIAVRSKVFLNIHKADVGTVHWPRMVMLGMGSGALVVSAPCAPHPDYIAGVHYLEESPRRIPKLIRWLLDAPDGQALADQVRAAAAAQLGGGGAQAVTRLLLNPVVEPA